MVKHTFTVKDYHKVFEAGALGHSRIELLEGEVYLEVFCTPDYQPIYVAKGTKAAPLAFPQDEITWWI
jgi:hypothetical protein